MNQTLLSGATLQGGKYIIKKVLGQGGFGITYLAEHDLLGTKVAIKEFFMKDFCNRDETTSQVTIGTESSREQVAKFREKFLKEARNIAKLHHPNIVRISDVFEENGTAYYVMDYCEGGSLSELIKLHPAGLGEPLALKYIRQVASALEQIHAQKMNHLDVKPANILLDAQGNAVLIDFGLSKQYDATGSQTSTTPVGISHGYAPIEQYKQGGVSEFSPATDIYSLGATLYKLITGQTPPDAQNLLEESLPSFSATDSVSNAIHKSMQVKRADRPQSIRECFDLLGSSTASSPLNTLSGNSSSFTSTNSNENDDEATRINHQSGWQEEEVARKQADIEAQRKAAEETRKKEELRQYEEDRKRKEAECKAKEEARLREDEKQKASSRTGLKVFLFILCVIFAIFFIIYSNDSKVEYSNSPVQQTNPVNNNVRDKVYRDKNGVNFTYSGEVKDNLPDGNGTGVYPYGTYIGEYRVGLRQGNGKFESNDGANKFEGTFSNDSYEVGTLQSSGLTFKGTFKDEQPYNGTWYNAKNQVYAKIKNGQVL